MTASGLGTSPSDGVRGGMISFELGGIVPAGCRLAAAASVERSLFLKKPPTSPRVSIQSLSPYFRVSYANLSSSAALPVSREKLKVSFGCATSLVG